jgi:hypothetical protein
MPRPVHVLELLNAITQLPSGTPMLSPLPASGPHRPLSWDSYDLSITVYADQQTHMPRLDGSKTDRAMVTRSNFPLFNTRVPAFTLDATTQFDLDLIPSGVSRFSLDLQWSSSSNFQFFRIDDIRIDWPITSP